MTRRAGRSAGLAILALVVAACLGLSPASVAPTGSAAAPSSASATGAASGDASLRPGGCPITEASGTLPSSRLIDLELADEGSADRLTFLFGEQGPEPLEGRGRLREAHPPFAAGGSGLPIEVDGERFLEIRFDGVLIGDEQGNAIYQGPSELRPNLPAVAHVVVAEQFEGVITFIVGLRGGGCVSLGGDPAAGTVVVEVAHG